MADTVTGDDDNSKKRSHADFTGDDGSGVYPLTIAWQLLRR